MRADFQQYYSLNLDGMGTAYSYSHAAVLCVQLPADSRVNRAINPDAAYTLTDLLLRQIERDLRVIAWQKTKDAQHGRNYPEPLPLPSEDKEHARKQAIEDRAYVDSVLGLGGESTNG